MVPLSTETAESVEHSGGTDAAIVTAGQKLLTYFTLDGGSSLCGGLGPNDQTM